MTTGKKGGGATEYGSYVWGTNQQPINGNLIQAVGDPNKYKGGRRKKSSRSGGEGVLTATAVPAVLITANHFYNPKRKSKRHSSFKPYKRGGAAAAAAMPSTQDMLAQTMTSINRIQNDILPQTPSGTIYTSSGETTTYSGGKGVLETMAVPAVLLTANHLYRPRKGTQKRGKRSRRYSAKRQ